MKKIIQYRIVDDDNNEAFEAGVDQLIAAGFTPIGNIVMTTRREQALDAQFQQCYIAVHHYAQALVKYDAEESDKG